MWDDVKLAMNFSLSFIDASGLMNVTSPNDWLRFGMGGHNIEVWDNIWNCPSIDPYLLERPTLSSTTLSTNSQSLPKP
jgi:hypothetical protein